MKRGQLAIHPEVGAALEAGGPVVALESTIVAHGMPYPENVETARRLEETIRAAGAVPATICVLGGRIKVGLTEDELERLGHGDEVVKVSRRDLPVVVARGLDGATTVAATMIVAAGAGIEVFVTGGLGGVHRGAGKSSGSHSFDVSADLPELARSRVAVVCAGAKAILDIGATLEYLETLGVPVLGFATDRFPAFYRRDSGFDVDCRLDSVEGLAAVIRTKRDLGLEGGLVVANPIPERHELDTALLDRVLGEALAEAAEAGVTGKRLTPFLLARSDELSQGRCLRANVELVLNNAELGARLACELAQ